MKTSLITLLISALAVMTLGTPAGAGLFQQSVELDDLAQLSPEGLEALKEEEYDALLARIQLADARAKESEASGALRTARRGLEVEQLDLKAARAEVKAARANIDSERIQAAAATELAAQRDIQRSEALAGWKKEAHKAAELAAESAEARVDFAEAKRDFSRVRRLIKEGVPAAGDYELKEFSKRQLQRQRDHDRLEDRAARAAREASIKQAHWQRLSAIDDE